MKYSWSHRLQSIRDPNMVWHYFCPLCGVLVGQAPSPHLSTDLPSSLKWYQEIRAGGPLLHMLLRAAINRFSITVRSVVGKSAPFLTGVGFLSHQGNITAHSDPALRYSASTDIPESYPTFYRSGSFWAFALHVICWDFLVVRVTNSVDDSKDIASSIAGNLFNILLSSAYNDKFIPMPGHDFGGAAQFQRPIGDPIRDTNNSCWRFLVSNPGVPQSKVIDSRLDMSSQGAKSGPEHTPIFHDGRDQFSRLPIEVIYIILAWLPSSDLISLCMTSKVIASLSKKELLPQSFWSSRFAYDFEMGFAFPLNIAPDPIFDWRAQYFAIKQALLAPDNHLSLLNRRRIWKILDSTASLIKSLINNKHNHTLSITWADLSPLSDFTTPFADFSIDHIITGQSIASEHAAPMSIGCRELEVQSLVWPPDSSTIGCSIGVSVVTFGCQIFVSGIRILPLGGILSSVRNAPPDLGHIVYIRETIIHCEPYETLEEVDVAVSAAGIHGLRLHFNGPRKRCTDWIGHTSNGKPDTGFGKLYLGQGKRLAAIAAGLDVCLPWPS